jgi:hypothetical protein
MSKLRFLGLFLLCFAMLLALWNVTPLSAGYTAALLEVAARIGPALHGWILEPATDGFPRWVRDEASVELKIQFDALAVGVVPLLALIGATPGLAPLRRLRVAAIATLLFFAIDVLIVVLFPLLVHYDNAATDIGGTFLGMIGFVGAPVILWFVLTFPQIRSSLPSLRPHTRPGSDAL